MSLKNDAFTEKEKITKNERSYTEKKIVCLTKLKYRIPPNIGVYYIKDTNFRIVFDNGLNKKKFCFISCNN